MTLSEKIDKNARLDRHSGSGLRGLPKKDGWGKGGWGKEGDELAEEDLYKLEKNMK